MYENEINEIINFLPKIGLLLLKLKDELKLKNKPKPLSSSYQEFYKIFSPPTASELASDVEREKKLLARLLPGSKEDLQLNNDKNSKISKSLKSNFKENNDMLIDFKGVSISAIPRTDGRYAGYVTFDNRRIYFYGKNKLEVEEKIKNALKNGVAKKPKKPTGKSLKEFTIEFFEKFRKRKVAPKTYVNDFSRLKHHIFPAFGDRLFKNISPSDCQDLIDSIIDSGKGKTADEVFSLLNVIFKGAIAHGIINKNPMALVYKEAHEREHGTALTTEEITFLKSSLENTPYIQPFMIYLYTGLRPNELATVRIEGAFIIARNSKRKTKKIQYKRIPITPMLAPYVKG